MEIMATAMALRMETKAGGPVLGKRWPGCTRQRASADVEMLLCAVLDRHERAFRSKGVRLARELFCVKTHLPDSARLAEALSSALAQALESTETGGIVYVWVHGTGAFAKESDVDGCRWIGASPFLWQEIR